MARIVRTDFDFGGVARIIGLPDPTLAQHPATKAYADALKAGFDFKDSVRVATTANITLSGTQTIDGIGVIASDRVLVKNQTTGADNGVYVVAAGAWTRATDFDTSPEVTAGATIPVEDGTANGDSVWFLATNNPITLATTALTFSKLGPSSAGGLAKFSQSVGDGAALSFAVTHNLGTLDVHISVHRISDGLQVEPDMTRTSTNVATILFTTPAPATNEFRVVVIG